MPSSVGVVSRELDLAELVDLDGYAVYKLEKAKKRLNTASNRNAELRLTFRVPAS